MGTTIHLTPDIQEILSRSTITEDRLVLPPEQLERKLYESVNKAITSAGGKWNRKAGAHLFKTDPREALGLAVSTGKVENRRNALQAFYTPRELADRVAEFAAPKRGDQVLEPSCGEGSLVAAMLRRQPGVCIVGLDIDKATIGAAHKLLELRLGDELRVADFLSEKPEPRFDIVVMNPPFAKNQDIDHVMHAWPFVKPGGRLVAIMSAGWSQRGGGRLKKRQAFNAFVEDFGGKIVELGGDAFKESGAWVHTVMVVLHKPGGAA